MLDVGVRIEDPGPPATPPPVYSASVGVDNSGIPGTHVDGDYMTP